MNILLSVLAVVFLTTGIVVSRKVDNSLIPPQSQHRVLSDSSVQTEANDISVSPSQTPTLLPLPTSAQVHSDDSVVEDDISTSQVLPLFIYPSSSVVSESKSKITLESSDDVTVITDWYKEKIKSESMNVTSFIVTSSNDHTLNKLSGSNGEISVLVTLKHDSNSAVSVTVELQ